jgi:hypothetical protein
MKGRPRRNVGLIVGLTLGAFLALGAPGPLRMLGAHFESPVGRYPTPTPTPTTTETPTPRPTPTPTPRGAGVRIEPTSLHLIEGQDGREYRISLTVRPLSDVTITIAFDDLQVTVDPTSLVFTPGNFMMPQFVTVTAIDDRVQESDSTTTLTHIVTSADADYNGLSTDDVVASIKDPPPGILKHRH